MSRIVDEIQTLQGKAREVILKYRDRWPRIAANYTLIGLLIWRDFDGMVVSMRDLKRASRGELSNLTSLQRSIADVRKPFLTDEERKRALDEEGAVHDWFAGLKDDEEKGW